MDNQSMISIQLTEDDHKKFKKFADLHSETMASLALKTIQEAIEDWEDVRDAEEILDRNEPTIPLEEVLRKAGL